MRRLLSEGPRCQAVLLCPWEQMSGPPRHAVAVSVTTPPLFSRFTRIHGFLPQSSGAQAIAASVSRVRIPFPSPNATQPT